MCASACVLRTRRVCAAACLVRVSVCLLGGRGEVETLSVLLVGGGGAEFSGAAIVQNCQRRSCLTHPPLIQHVLS